MKITIRKLLKEWIIPYAALAVILSLIFHFVFFFPVVPTGSMIPTILEHSLLFATRVHNAEKDLERGDVVVFQSDEMDILMVKRLIGLPGEKISIDEEGSVSIDGTPLEEPYVKHNSPKSGEFEVPKGCYFFLGDNRRNSADARLWENPYIPRDKIEGKAVFTIWPVSKLGPLK